MDNFVEYVAKKMDTNVYLVFDRYFDYSIKGVTYLERGKEASSRHQFSRLMLLPPQKITLTVTSNKVQLFDLIVKTLHE